MRVDAHDYVLITDADNRISLPHSCLNVISEFAAKRTISDGVCRTGIALFSTRYPR